jgi:hypothetical protein
VLTGSVAVGLNARASESEEQRGGAINRHENKSDELCRILCCELEKSQGGYHGMD